MKKQVSTAHTLLGVVFTILFSHSSSFAQLPSYVPTDGLVGYWPFNGNANDESGNGNDGVVNGGVILTKDRFGEENAAYKFNGDKSFINTNTKPFTSKGVTISCWFSTLSTNEGYVGLVVARNKTNWANGLYLFDNRDCIFYTNNCTSDPRIGHRDPNINKGEWHHYVGIYDGEQLSNYVDGVLTGQMKISQDVCVTDPFLIGDDNCCGRYFIGNLDDIGIWNRALTHKEIQELYTGCNLVSDIDPTAITIAPGQSASFNAIAQDSVSHWQWQSQIAEAGWSTLSDNNRYSGAKTSTLKVSEAQVNQHQQQFRVVASNALCTDTSDVAILLLSDTCLVTLTDTILTTVTDTLLIDVVLSSTSTPGSNLIRVYPNPTSSQLVIDAGQHALMAGYTLTVTAANGAAVWTEAIAQPVYTLDLSSWGGKGLYYITLTDPQGKIITTRKIVLQ